MVGKEERGLGLEVGVRGKDGRPVHRVVGYARG